MSAKCPECNRIKCTELEVGKTYFIKTLAHYYIGTVVDVTPTEFSINTVVEIYDTGQIHNFFSTGKPQQCCDYPPEIVMRISRFGNFITDWIKPIPARTTNG